MGPSCVAHSRVATVFNRCSSAGWAQPAVCQGMVPIAWQAERILPGRANEVRCRRFTDEGSSGYTSAAVAAGSSVVSSEGGSKFVP